MGWLIDRDQLWKFWLWYPNIWLSDSISLSYLNLEFIKKSSPNMSKFDDYSCPLLPLWLWTLLNDRFDAYLLKNDNALLFSVSSFCSRTPSPLKIASTSFRFGFWEGWFAGYIGFELFLISLGNKGEYGSKALNYYG